MTVPAPAEVLVLIASAIREARKRRDWSQAKLAEESGVSLAQVGLLEKGRNVSVVFLSKVAGRLNLRLSLTDGADQFDAGAARLDVFELIRKTDLLAMLVDDLRAIATDAVLPPIERGKLKDTPLVEQFIERALAGDEDAFERLGDVIRGISRETQPSRRGATPSSLPERPAAKGTAVHHRRRTKKRERE